MRRFLKDHPAAALFLLAVALGVAPMAPVSLGLLPAGFVQLGAPSASAAGIILAAVEGGKGSVRELLSRALIWRVGVRWWLAALLLPAVVTVAAIHLAAALSGRAPTLGGVEGLVRLVPTLLFLVVFAGFGEEFGWRGFAVPRVQTRHGALAASLIIGGFHALWHIPLFFVEGVGQEEVARQLGFWPAFLGYAVMVLALAVQATWIFNNTRGSVLLAAVYHGAVNTAASYLDLSPGRLGGMYVYIGMMVAASALIVLVFGPAHLSRSGARPTWPPAPAAPEA